MLPALGDPSIGEAQERGDPHRDLAAGGGRTHELAGVSPRQHHPGGDDITLLNRLLDLDLRAVERVGELGVEGAQAGEVPDAFGIAVDDDIASCRTGDPTPKTTGTTRTSQ